MSGMKTSWGRVAAGLVLSMAARAECPTSAGFPRTCFVSLAGSNSNPGTISSPKLTIEGAISIMAPGDTVMLRGGRYTQASGNSGFATNVGCTAALPCTLRAFPGEVVIIDGRSWGGSNAFFGASFGSHTQEPPYANDPKTGHWRVTGLRIENVPRFPIWLQSQNDGVHLKALRITGTQGIRLSSCDGCRLHGVYVDVRGVSVADGANGPAFDCTPVLPGNTQVPWMSTSYDAAGKPGTVPHYYQLANVAPRFPAIAAYGCRDLQVMDSHFEKELSSATDTFGVEYGRDIHVERTRFIAPWAYGHEGNYGGSTGGTDAFDMKATGITVKDVEAYGGKATMKLWGKVNLVQNTLVVHSEDGGEAGVSFAGQLGTASSAWPPSTTFNPIHFAGNTPDGDAYVVASGGGPTGNSPVDGTHVEISNVPGCTSINKEVRIKSSVENKHVIFVLENTDGSQLSCNGQYDLSQLTTRTQDRTFTTPGGTTDLTASSAPSFGTYGQFLNGRVFFSSTGTLPSPLQPSTPYYVVYLSGATFRVAAAPGAASSAITLTTTGSGTHTATFYDDYASYAGEMRVPTSAAGRATWGVTVRNLTAISSRGTALYACTNCGSTDYASRKFTYSLSDSIVVSPRLPTIAAPIAVFGGPRAVFAGNVVHLSEHQPEKLAIGRRVSFRTIGVLPPPLQAGAEYWIVSSDPVLRTIQISTSHLGAPLTVSGGAGRHWLISKDWSSRNVELSSAVNLAAGQQVTLRTTGTLPYPLAPAKNYQIDSLTTVSVNGVSVPLAQLSDSGAPLSFRSAGQGVHKLYRSGVSANSGTRNYEVGGYTERLNTARNTYWSGAGAGTAYCAKVDGDPGFNAASNCAAAGEVPALEAGSTVADPAIDLWTGRATASTPESVRNRGRWGRQTEVLAGIGRALLRTRQASAAEPVEAVIATTPDFSVIHETLISAERKQWREFEIGTTAALSPGQTYYWRVRQGHDVETGSFTTRTAGGPARPLKVAAAAPPGAAGAVLETRTEGGGWAVHPEAACAGVCTLSAEVAAGLTAYRYQWRDSQGVPRGAPHSGWAVLP